MGEVASIRNNRVVRGALAIGLGMVLASCTSAGEGTAATPSAGIASPEVSPESSDTTPSTAVTPPYLETVTDPDGALVIEDPQASDGFLASYDQGVRVPVLCTTANESDKIPGDTLYRIDGGPYDADYTPALSYNNGVVDPNVPDCTLPDPAVAGD